MVYLVLNLPTLSLSDEIYLRKSWWNLFKKNEEKFLKLSYFDTNTPTEFKLSSPSILKDLSFKIIEKFDIERFLLLLLHIFPEYPFSTRRVRKSTLKNLNNRQILMLGRSIRSFRHYEQWTLHPWCPKKGSYHVHCS